jgi:hypothetical protein
MTTNRNLEAVFILILLAAVIQNLVPSLSGEMQPGDSPPTPNLNENGPPSSTPLQQTPGELAANLAAELLLSPMPYYIDLPVILR